MLLHIGDDSFIDSSHLIMVLNRDVIFCEENETNLKIDLNLKNDSNIKSLIISDNTAIIPSLIDSQTLYKRKNVLAFTHEETELGEQKQNVEDMNEPRKHESKL